MCSKSFGRESWSWSSSFSFPSMSYLVRTPCVPLFCTLFNRGGDRRAFRQPGEGGDHSIVRWNPRPVISGAVVVRLLLPVCRLPSMLLDAQIASDFENNPLAI